MSVMGAMGSRIPRRFTGRSSGVTSARSALNALAVHDPEMIRSEVIEKGREPFIDGLLSSLREPGHYCAECKRGGRERWAFRLFAELAQIVGSSTDIAVQVVNIVGASVGDARVAVSAADRASQLSDTERARLWAKSLHDFCAENGIDGLVIPEQLAASKAEAVEEGTA